MHLIRHLTVVCGMELDRHGIGPLSLKELKGEKLDFDFYFTLLLTGVVFTKHSFR